MCFWNMVVNLAGRYAYYTISYINLQFRFVLLFATTLYFITVRYYKGLSIKGVSSQEEWELSSADFFQTKGIFQMRMSAFLVQNFFRNLQCVDCVRTEKGVKPFRKRKWESVFCNFVWTFFYRRPQTEYDHLELSTYE